MTIDEAVVKAQNKIIHYTNLLEQEQAKEENQRRVEWWVYFDKIQKYQDILKFLEEASRL